MFDVHPSCPFHYRLLEAGTRRDCDLPPHHSFTSPPLIHMEKRAAGEGGPLAFVLRTDLLQNLGHGEAVRQPRSGATGAAGGGEAPGPRRPAGRQCCVNHCRGDEGRPNLQLPALTESLIIFKWGEWMPRPAIIHLLCC